ncbi:hypothetical protein D3C84_1130220 [compost metagenome]
MSSRALSRALTASSRNRKVKASATLPRKIRLVLLRFGTRLRPNWITSEGVICARRWNTLFCRKSLTQCKAGWRPSIFAACRMR